MPDSPLESILENAFAKIKKRLIGISLWSNGKAQQK